jgi:hypothetical protein
MPAVAIIGAVGSVSMGMGAMATAATLGAKLAAGAMIAGGVLTGVGTLTKNPKLTKLGAILGLGGGLGVAMTKGAASSASSGLGLKAASEPALSSSGIGTAASNLAEMGGGQGLTMGSAVKTAGDTLTGSMGASLGGASPGGIIGSNTGSISAAAAPALSGEVSAASQALSGSGLRPPVQATTSGRGIYDIAGAYRPAESVAGQDTSLFGRTMGFLRDKQNAEILKLGSGLVQGAMDSYGQQQAVKEQLRQQQAARDRYNNSILGQNLYRY